MRIGLAAVFLWFGGDKFVYPNYWLTAWIPLWLQSLGEGLGIPGRQLVYVIGVFEILVGLSLLINFLIRSFSFLAIIFLIILAIGSSFSEVTVRDFGLIGGLMALIFWPERRRGL